MENNSTISVYTTVRERITTKEYRPGYHIIEDNIAEEFGLSRSPVRNALKQLCEEGFLVHSAGKGFFVSTDEASYTILHDIRRGVDSAAAILVAERCGLNELVDLCRYAETADSADDAERICADKLFHEELIRLSGSPLIGEFFEYLTPLITYSRNLQLTPTHNGKKGVINSHTVICDCIKGAKLMNAPSLAEQGVQLHYACGEKLYSFTEERAPDEEERGRYEGYYIGDDVKALFAKKMDLIYRDLFNAIISGKLKANDRINEAQLAGALGCSRVTVRAAVQKLEKYGYVKFVQNKGAIVCGIDPSSHSDLLWGRYAVEPVASLLCAKTMTSAEKRKMADIIKDGRAAYKERDYLHSLICDTEFHNLIVESSRNIHIKKLYNMIAERTHYERCLLRDEHSKDAAVWPEQSLIFRAICDGNDEAAFLTMQTHLKRIYGF